MTRREAEIIEIIHKEVKPALGCTEPIAVALAAAKSVETLMERLQDFDRASGHYHMIVNVSGNILKNGMGVGIPGTGMIGLRIAAALGAACGKSEYALEVLKDLDDNGIALAKKLVDRNAVEIVLEKGCPKLYVRTEITSAGHTSSCTIKDEHDKITEVRFDGETLHSTEYNDNRDGEEERNYNLTVREIYDFATSIAYEDIKFILDDRKYNLALSEEGLKGTYGLKVGRTIAENSEEVFGNDFLSYAMSLTAAASDARMAGCTLPAMSNSGSGNQGITVSMPVIAYALKYGVSDEKLARALIISNLTAIHIKEYLGRLSALCGCVVASTGSSCGLVWLKGGGYEEICYAIKNMVGNITGMICDGAKVGCAMKVASGVACSVQSAVLALKHIHACVTDGIVDDDIEKTIGNLGSIGTGGMEIADELIQKIMICK